MGCFKLQTWLASLQVCPRHPLWYDTWYLGLLGHSAEVCSLSQNPSTIICDHCSGGFYLLCLLILSGGTRVKGYGSISSEEVKPFIHCCIHLGWAGLQLGSGYRGGGPAAGSSSVQDKWGKLSVMILGLGNWFQAECRRWLGSAERDTDSHLSARPPCDKPQVTAPTLR